MHARCCRDQDPSSLASLSFNFPLLLYPTLPCGALLPALSKSPSMELRSWRCIGHPTPLRLAPSFQPLLSQAIHIFLFLPFSRDSALGLSLTFSCCTKTAIDTPPPPPSCRRRPPRVNPRLLFPGLFVPTSSVTCDSSAYLPSP